MKRLLLLAATYIGLCMAGGTLLLDHGLHRSLRSPVTAADRARAADLAGTLGARLEAVSIAARDGAMLRGWIFSPAQANSHSVLLVHGVTATRAAMLPVARLFLEQGYRALAVDLRAHGESDGQLSTFGALEADDLRGWIAWTRAAAPNACVYQLGGSLGATLAIQAADAPGVCAVVAQAASASQREMAFDWIGQQLSAGAWAGRSALRPGVEFAFLYARVRYGLDLAEVSAVAAVSRPGPPILLIHGTHDDKIPARHALLIQAANPARVSLWLVPGGSHESLGQSAAAEYPRRVLDFLARHREAPR